MKNPWRLIIMNRIKVILVLCIFVVCTYFVQAEEEALAPRKVQVDSNFDGVIDRIEYYDESGQVIRVESDTDFDGIYDEWVYYRNGKVEKAEKDTNGDGKPDTWIEY